jgi:hypothetical protein
LVKIYNVQLMVEMRLLVKGHSPSATKEYMCGVFQYRLIDYGFCIEKIPHIIPLLFNSATSSELSVFIKWENHLLNIIRLDSLIMSEKQFFHFKMHWKKKNLPLFWCISPMHIHTLSIWAIQNKLCNTKI